jgi:predicted DNA-binding protein (MmcQ/YjbR family)
MQAEEAIERLRELARRLPGTEETLSFGIHPTFKAGKKTFAVLEHHQHSVTEDHIGRPAVTFKVPIEMQKALCDSGGYFVAPYVGKYGWVYALLDSGTGWDEIEELVIESYRMAATKRMLKELDGKQETKR